SYCHGPSTVPNGHTTNFTFCLSANIQRSPTLSCPFFCQRFVTKHKTCVKFKYFIYNQINYLLLPSIDLGEVQETFNVLMVHEYKRILYVYYQTMSQLHVFQFLYTAYPIQIYHGINDLFHKLVDIPKYYDQFHQSQYLSRAIGAINGVINQKNFFQKLRWSSIKNTIITLLRGDLELFYLERYHLNKPCSYHIQIETATLHFLCHLVHDEVYLFLQDLNTQNYQEFGHEKLVSKKNYISNKHVNKHRNYKLTIPNVKKNGMFIVDVLNFKFYGFCLLDIVINDKKNLLRYTS
ncbi:hypothetical protein AGLY_014809, partial [Aphis glycines]